MLDLHHLDADSAYHNWLEQNGVLHSPEIERAFTASFNILSRFIAGPEQQEVDWFVVREAIVDTCDEGGIGTAHQLEAIFAKRGLLVVHRKEQEVSKPVMLCTCGKVLENPAAYAAHCAEAPDHFIQS